MFHWRSSSAATGSGARRRPRLHRPLGGAGRRAVCRPQPRRSRRRRPGRRRGQPGGPRRRDGRAPRPSRPDEPGARQRRRRGRRVRGPGPRRRSTRSSRAPPGLALGVLVADCVPVLLHDARGRRRRGRARRPARHDGAASSARAVSAMRDLGAAAIVATVGPSVCGRCYEVPADMAARRGAGLAVRRPHGRGRARRPSTSPPESSSSWPAECVAVQWIPGCTRETRSLYSYRRDGVTGRFAGVVIMLRREAPR